MKLWTVYGDEWSSPSAPSYEELIGIFFTEEEAIKFSEEKENKFKETHIESYNHYDCRIDPWEVDIPKSIEIAIQAMESAWFELKPGKSKIGDQFIRQDDMREVIDNLKKLCEI